MKPSVLSTSSTRSRCLEPGIETFDLARICALRMRAIMSPIGSFTISSLLPARLHEAGNKPLGTELAQRDAGQAMLAVIGARPAGHLAAVAHAIDRRIARQFGQLESRGKTLFGRQFLVARDRLESRTPAGILLGQLLTSIVLFDRTLLRHYYRSLFPRLRTA